MSVNHLINIADELAAGKTSLKDLFYDQLITDILTLKDKDVDVTPDEEYYVPTEDCSKFASFDFTQSVMARIAAQEDVIIDSEFDDLELDSSVDLPHITLENMAKPTYEYGANLNTNTHVQRGAFFSQAVEEKAADNSQVANNSQASDVVTKTSIFNRRNLFGAALAFIATFATVGVFNKLNEQSSFSTIAYT
ncbi:hypothetical protein, partial [Psittacicella hinzii]